MQAYINPASSRTSFTVNSKPGKRESIIGILSIYTCLVPSAENTSIFTPSGSTTQTLDIPALK